MFTLLRNINTNSNRIDYLNKEYSFNFKLYTLVKLPNTGDPIYGPGISGLVSQSAYEALGKVDRTKLTASEQLQMSNMNKLYIDASFKLVINTKDYLTGSRDLRWNLQSKNAYASIFGEEDNFYMFVVMSEKSDTASSGTVSFYPNLNLDSDNVYIFGVRFEFFHYQNFEDQSRNHLDY